MKKILLVFDGQHFSEGVFEFAKQMNRHQRILAVGLFLPGIDYAELLYSYGGVMTGPLYTAETVPMDDAVLKKNIEHFQELCAQNSIVCEVDKDLTRHVVSHITEESRFADLLVISSESFYENLGVDTQDEYITNVLHKTQCPVMMVPDDYHEPRSVILAYDGSEQSVYAIKQYSYIFPESQAMQALLVYFHKGKRGVPERDSIESLVSNYFKNLTISSLNIDTKKDLGKWMQEHGNSMLVAGAYGRSLISETFKESFVHGAIRDHKVPIFIAHQ